MKAIIFDFDGTITYKSKNIWSWVWAKLGLSDVYHKLYEEYKAGKYNYQEWCDITCDIFRDKRLQYNDIKTAASETKLIKGFGETVKELKEKGIGLYIVSGSIIEGIELVLGENVKYFDKIIANHFVFDKKGVISRINATKYDYEGKSVFASELIKKLDISPKELCFIGNGDNDEWVYKTGCRTICINPDGADFSNTVKWSRCIQQSDDFRDLLPIIESVEEENERE